MKRTISMHLAAGALALLCLAGCQRHPENEVVLARVGDSRLTLRTLEDNIPLGFKEMFTREQKEEYINRWIDDELLYQEALHAGLHRDPDIEATISQMTRDFLIQKLLERRTEKNVTIREEEIKSYYARHRNDFILEHPVFHGLQILVKDNKTAWEVMRKVRKEEDFGALAREYSIDPSADLDGDMGYFSEWDVDPKIVRQCTRQQVDQVANPIHTQSGYHIIKLVDKRAKGDPKPLELVRENIINILNKEKKQEGLENLIKELKRKHAITVNLDALDRHRTAPAAEPPAPPPAAQGKPDDVTGAGDTDAE